MAARRECLAAIADADDRLYSRFQGVIRVEPALTRQLVSFQANKTAAAYRWYKYKEAFSSALVEYLFDRWRITAGSVLDPFAGMGTSLFVASRRGMNADGVELLPVGQELIRIRCYLEEGLAPDDWRALQRWLEERPWRHSEERVLFNEVAITRGSYPPETKAAIERYLALLRGETPIVRQVLRFALLCVLEAVSYTRKDGQYLRWDARAGRSRARPFDKKAIASFDEAITAKLSEILADAAHLRSCSPARTGRVRLLPGSCFDVLPTLPAQSYDVVVTSPPYCNRYDYTRTYALELALLGVSEAGFRTLRQAMLSCTVENRPKDLAALNQTWADAVSLVDRQELLQLILAYLEAERERRALNNSGIPRMVRGYFHEMACVIAECRRLLRPDGLLFMVNDNVRYAGAGISVDLILSDIAQSLGFAVENILVLPQGKGNSSQQMGEHGRVPLRKCVYVWRAPARR